MSALLCAMSAIIGYQYACMKEGIYGTKKINTNEDAELSEGYIYNRLIIRNISNNGYRVLCRSIRPIEIIKTN